MAKNAPKTRLGLRARALQNVAYSKNFIVIGDKESLMAIELTQNLKDAVEVALMRSSLESFRDAIEKHIVILDKHEPKVKKSTKRTKTAA